MLRFLSMADDIAALIERAFGSSLSDILIQIVATILLVIIVKVFFWDKVNAYLKKRREVVQKELDDAENAHQEAKDIQEKREQEYQDLKNQSKEFIENAKSRGESEREIIVNKAKDEANKIMTQAEQEIELEKQKAKADIQAETVELATLMASKILEKEIDDKKYQNLSVEKLEGSE